MAAARRVAAAYGPLGIFTLQNNGVFCGQETPYLRFHVVPRQPGSDWGIGLPQLARIEGAGRQRGFVHDPGDDGRRRQRVQVSTRELAQTAARIRSKLPP